MKRKEKFEAIKLRQRGHSLGEIAHTLGISKSTASVWVHGLVLNKIAHERLSKRWTLGSKMAAKANREKRISLNKLIANQQAQLVSKITPSCLLDKVMCALLYWCEGAKQSSNVQFSNSDPLLVKLFLRLFRSAFRIEEQKFRVCVHLHEYHDKIKQTQFWSHVTNIPLKQFFIYRKHHTGKRKKEGYKGCLSIRYYDYRVATELNILWKIFGENYRRVG